ncbi:uncharacterized protein VTP21DRAFT_2520 [Calcarisporiella thermophila]|uniref:uncharacterized protein n=1 Tax=Calcarisporiella thermophila TaxID=911321 RepID=UPI00374358F6
MIPPPHREKVLSLYRSILKEATKFFDDRSRIYIVKRAREGFRKYKKCEDGDRIQYRMAETRRLLHQLERANNPADPTAALRILELAYGRRGKIRHALLRPFLSSPSSTRPEPLIPHSPRTAPPAISQELRALLTPQVKHVDPVMPEARDGRPLHLRRVANISWRNWSKNMKVVKAPVPIAVMQELEKKASVGLAATPRESDNTEEDILRGIRVNWWECTHREKTWFDRWLHSSHSESGFTQRQRRRLYQRLLNSIPQVKNGNLWRSAWAGGKPIPLVSGVDRASLKECLEKRSGVPQRAAASLKGSERSGTLRGVPREIS